jgi:hypothetical protein
MDLIGVLDSVYKYCIAPLGIFFWWLFKKYDAKLDRHEEELDLLRKELDKLDQRVTQEVKVFEVKLDALRDGIDDIKSQLGRLFDILERRK